MQIVVDYSSLTAGAASKNIKAGEVIVPVSVVALLESEMRANKADGFVGTKDLLALKEMASKGKIELRYSGQKPRFISKEEADWEAREIARIEGAILLTRDKVQRNLSEALGIEIFYIKDEEHLELSISKFFDNETMSIHVKEGLPVFAKKGHPGAWEFTQVTDEPLPKEEVEDMSREIIEKAEQNPLAFIELNKEGATVVQYENYRIVVTHHPFTKRTEITAVRPVVKLTLDDYDLPKELMDRFEQRAEGIVIAGSPGAGKTTFAQALAEFYARKKKIVKTIEHPRDLNVIPEITQYGHLEGDPAGTGEILLLVRPDFTVYDELRGTRDFQVYSDMRLAGVGMIGVVHASRAIDAIQRFLGRLEMGVIPQVLDTVLYIKGGKIEKVYELEMVVKVPSGMTEADLARPVVEIRDFFTKKAEFEIYTYGEETTIVPVKEIQSDPLTKLAERELRRSLKKDIQGNVEVKITGERSATIYVESEHIPYVIGKKGKNIEALEKKTGLKIDVRNIDDLPKTEVSKGEEVRYDMDENKKAYVFYFDRHVNGRQVDFYAGDEYVFSAVVSKKGKVKINKDSELGKQLHQLLAEKREIVVKV